MKRLLIAGVLTLAAASASAQQPAPAEIIDALNLKAGQLQQNLDQSYLALAVQKKALAEEDARLKWVLDNWVPKVGTPKPPLPGAVAPTGK